MRNFSHKRMLASGTGGDDAVEPHAFVLTSHVLNASGDVRVSQRADAPTASKNVRVLGRGERIPAPRSGTG